MQTPLAKYSPDVHFDSSELDAFESTARPPEHRLFMAILIRALKDLANKEQHIARSAWVFIRRKHKRPFSFKWLCIHLDLDFQYFQKLTPHELQRISESLYNL